MAYTVKIDKQTCQSSGRCTQAAPELFVLDADHLAEVLPDPPELPDARLLEIARGCPACAIQLYDPSGREVDPF